jgi:hypothetical protein
VNNLMIIVSAALLVAVFCGRRLADMKPQRAVLGWLVLALALAAPLATTWKTIFPGDPLETLLLEPGHKGGSLDIPEGTVILATGALIDVAEDEEVDVSKQLTRYVLELTGESGWTQSLAGVVYRVSKSGPTIDADGREGIQSTGGYRLFGTGKDHQTRFWPFGTGATTLTASQWEGEAITSLRLDVVPAPPEPTLIWPVVILLGVLALVSDTFLGSDHMAIDIGFLAFPCYFITQEVTPESGLREVIFAMSSGALLGGLSLGFVGYVLERIFAPKARPLPVPAGKKPA